MGKPEEYHRKMVVEWKFEWDIPGLVISMEMVFEKVFNGIIVDEYHDHGIRLG